jgi:hypothetical protein
VLAIRSRLLPTLGALVLAGTACAEVSSLGQNQQLIFMGNIEVGVCE